MLVLSNVMKLSKITTSVDIDQIQVYTFTKLDNTADFRVTFIANFIEESLNAVRP